MITSKIGNVVPDGNGVRVFVDFIYLDGTIKNESYVFDVGNTFEQVNDFIFAQKTAKENNLIKAQELAAQLLGGGS